MGGGDSPIRSIRIGPEGSRPRLLNVGGNWNDGSGDGLSAFNANNALGNSNANIGARLATHPNIIMLGLDLASRQKTTN